MSDEKRVWFVTLTDNTTEKATLTDEERAERAWEREYPVNNKLHRINEDAVRDVYIGWKAGYLAARKERGK